MRTLLLALFTIGFGVPGTFSSCDPCDCPVFGVTLYDLLGVESVTQLRRGSSLTSPLAAFDTVSFGEHGGILLVESIRYAAASEPESGAGAWPSVGIIPSAMACDCQGPTYGLADGVSETRAQFVTLYDFDEEHPAGTPISEALVFGDALRIPDADANVSRLASLTVPPTASDTFQVRYELELSNGQTFSRESVPVVFMR